MSKNKGIDFLLDILSKIKSKDIQSFLRVYHYLSSQHAQHLSAFTGENNLNQAVIALIEKVLDSKVGEECITALNSFAKLMKYEVISLTDLTTHDKETIKNLLYFVLKTNIVDYDDLVSKSHSSSSSHSFKRLHNPNHQLRTFLGDITLIAPIFSDDPLFLKKVVETINYYFNIYGKNHILNTLDIKTDLITAGNLSQALEIFSTQDNFNQEQKNFIEESILLWVEKLNKKWCYNVQDISYITIYIGTLINKNLFSKSVEKKLLIQIKKLISDSNKEDCNIIGGLNFLKGLIMVYHRPCFRESLEDPDFKRSIETMLKKYLDKHPAFENSEVVSLERRNEFSTVSSQFIALLENDKGFQSKGLLSINNTAQITQREEKSRKINLLTQDNFNQCSMPHEDRKLKDTIPNLIKSNLQGEISSIKVVLDDQNEMTAEEKEIYALPFDSKESILKNLRYFQWNIRGFSDTSKEEAREVNSPTVEVLGESSISKVNIKNKLSTYSSIFSHAPTFPPGLDNNTPSLN